MLHQNVTKVPNFLSTCIYKCTKRTFCYYKNPKKCNKRYIRSLQKSEKCNKRYFLVLQKYLKVDKFFKIGLDFCPCGGTMLVQNTFLCWMRAKRIAKITIIKKGSYYE